MPKTKVREPLLLDNMSIMQFCAWVGYSERQYYREKAEGLGPRELKIGRRVIITREAALKWRSKREVDVDDE